MTMDDQQFKDRAKKALKAKTDGCFDDAANELRALLFDLIPAAKAGVNDWHHQQVLSLLVDVLEEAGRDEECRAAWEELIHLIEQSATYWQTAMASASEDFAVWNAAHRKQ